MKNRYKKLLAVALSATICSCSMTYVYSNAAEPPVDSIGMGTTFADYFNVKKLVDNTQLKTHGVKVYYSENAERKADGLTNNRVMWFLDINKTIDKTNGVYEIPSEYFAIASYGIGDASSAKLKTIVFQKNIEFLEAGALTPNESNIENIYFYNRDVVLGRYAIGFNTQTEQVSVEGSTKKITVLLDPPDNAPFANRYSVINVYGYSNSKVQEYCEYYNEKYRDFMLQMMEEDPVKAQYTLNSDGNPEKFHFVPIDQTPIVSQPDSSSYSQTSSQNSSISSSSTIDYSNHKLGDLDDSGTLTPNDALLILRYVVGDFDPSEQEKYKVVGDADRDGQITPADALQVLKVVVGLIPSL